MITLNIQFGGPTLNFLKDKNVCLGEAEMPRFVNRFV